MSATIINFPSLHLILPNSGWTEHSTKDQYEFRLGDQEQVIVVFHLAHQRLGATEIQKIVTELFRIRLQAAQKISGDSCSFDSPVCTQSGDRFDTSVFGHDGRQRFRLCFGFIGMPEKIVAVSYYDYTGSRSPEQFKSRAVAIISSIQI